MFRESRYHLFLNNRVYANIVSFSESPIFHHENPVFAGLDTELRWENEQEKKMGGDVGLLLNSKKNKDRLNEQDFIDLTSNDYFFLKNIPEALLAQNKFINRGQKLSSPVFQEEERELISNLVKILGSEHVFSTSSGYLANIAAISQLAPPDCPVYFDSKVHVSCYTAITAVKGKGLNSKLALEARKSRLALKTRELTQEDRTKIEDILKRVESLSHAYSFRHNDPADLKKKIERAGRGVVIVDGLYSVEGDLVKPEVVFAAQEQGCLVMIDEAHSLLGTATKALSVNEQLNLNADIITASTSKAGAAHGGLVSIQPPLLEKYLKHLNKERNTEYKRQMERHFGRAYTRVFSNAAHQGEMLAFNARINFLLGHTERSQKVRDMSAVVVQTLKEAGISLVSESPMMFLKCGIHETTVNVRDYLQNKYDILGSLYIFPATRWDETGVRFCLNYDFCSNNEQIEKFTDAIIETSSKFNLT